VGVLRCADNLESNFAGQCTPADTDAQCLAHANGQYRLSYDAPVSDADMMQTFLPPFESVVKSAHIRGIMSVKKKIFSASALCADDGHHTPASCPPWPLSHHAAAELSRADPAPHLVGAGVHTTA
jgi:hypothetical protein